MMGVAQMPSTSSRRRRRGSGSVAGVLREQHKRSETLHGRGPPPPEEVTGLSARQCVASAQAVEMIELSHWAFEEELTRSAVCGSQVERVPSICCAADVMWP